VKKRNDTMVFFPELEKLSPREITDEFGLRISRNRRYEYRLYTLEEIKQMLVEEALRPVRPPSKSRSSSSGVDSCLRCPLGKGVKKNEVKASENIGTASVLFVGEAPGVEEVEKGIPFVGPAGRCLRKFIRLAGLVEEDCAFVNTVRCRPPVKDRPYEVVPSNRPPEAVEIACCSRYLEEDLQRFHGKLIVLLGNTPLDTLLGRWHVGAAHGHGFLKDGRRFYVMYHPSYILRDQRQRHDAMYLEEMRKIKVFLDSEHKIPYNIVDDCDKTEAMVKSILDEANKRDEGAIVTFDVESSGFDPLAPDAVIVSMSFTLRNGPTWWIPMNHRESPNLDYHKEIAKIVSPLFIDSRVKMVAQNAKFDLKFMQAIYGVRSTNLWLDTQLAVFLLEGKHSPQGLHQCAWKFTDHGGWDIDASNLVEESLEKIANYNTMDTFVGDELAMIYEKRLSPTAFEFLITILTKAVYTLIEMELEGVTLDLKVLEETYQEYNKEACTLFNKLASYKEVRTVAEKLQRDVNFNSGSHLRSILEEMKLVSEKKTKKTQKMSVDEEALETIKGKHPFVTDLLKYRTTAKIISTYLIPYTKLNIDGVVRGEYMLTRTATGRPSCQKPNFQNIPKEIRPVFRSKRGLFVEVDYSQMELRVLAMYSHDQALIDAFRSGEDIHEVTRMAIFGPNDDLSELAKAKQRVEAKSVNFGIVYGESAHGLSKQLKISMREADKKIEAFYTKYTGIKGYVDTIRKQIRSRGYVETFFGRRRYFATENVRDQAGWEALFREGVNAPIQGTASDLVLDAASRVWMLMRKRGMESCMVMNVHDMILFDCPENEVPEMLLMIYDQMERFDHPWVNVPIKVDVAIGTNWGALVGIE